jgi:hypothetical protein
VVLSPTALTPSAYKYCILRNIGLYILLALLTGHLRHDFVLTRHQYCVLPYTVHDSVKEAWPGLERRIEQEL